MYVYLQSKEKHLQQEERQCRSYLTLGSETVEMFRYLTEYIQLPFLIPVSLFYYFYHFVFVLFDYKYVALVVVESLYVDNVYCQHILVTYTVSIYLSHILLAFIGHIYCQHILGTYIVGIYWSHILPAYIGHIYCQCLLVTYIVSI